MGKDGTYLPCVGGPLDGKWKQWLGPAVMVAKTKPGHEEEKEHTYEAGYCYFGEEDAPPLYWRWSELPLEQAVKRVFTAYKGSTPCTT